MVRVGEAEQERLFARMLPVLERDAACSRAATICTIGICTDNREARGRQ